MGAASFCHGLRTSSPSSPRFGAFRASSALAACSNRGPWPISGGKNASHGHSISAATSNTLPDALGEGRFSAQDFLREIQGLRAHFVPVRVDGGRGTVTIVSEGK